MNKGKFFYTLLKKICIISTVAFIIIYIIQFTKVGGKPFVIFELMYIHIIVTCIWSYLMGIIMIVKAYLLYKESKLKYCIWLLLLGLLTIVFTHYIAGFLLVPFYNA